MQRIDRSIAPMIVPQQSYGTRVNQLKGWGTSGGVYSAMLAGFGLEFNTTADFFGESGIRDGDRSQWGISASLYTPATLGGGVGFGSYVELGYTFLWEI